MADGALPATAPPAAGRTGRRARLLLAAGAGGLLTLAQPPVSAWPLLALALPALFLLLRAADGPGPAFRTGWAAGTAFFGSGLFWVAEAFFVDAARHGWMAPLAVLGLAAGLGLFWGAAFWGAARLAPQGPRGRMLLLLPLWSLAEVARGHVLTGFPWAMQAQAWIDTPVAQGLALAGPHGLSLLTLASALALAAAARRGGPGRRAVLAALALLPLAALWAWGGARLAGPSALRADGVTVRLVQPNSPQDEKWNDARAEQFFRRMLDLSAEPGAPAVVIWPETAVPWLMEAEPAARALIAAAARAPVILGSRRLRSEGGRRTWWNALLLLDPGGGVAAAYDKVHLVPFGEYVPLAGLVERWGLTGLVGASFTPGAGAALLSAPGVPPFRPLICYEAIFPEEIDDAGRPDWLVQITNDAWFGASAGPWQHFAQARMRAIEQGLPLARVATTGISAMIDPKGRVSARIPLLEAGRADSPLPAPLPPTPYSRTGDGPVLALLALLVVMGVTWARGSSLRN